MLLERCDEAAAAVPADLIAEAKANIEPRLRAANHFYTWMEIVVGDADYSEMSVHMAVVLKWILIS